jgi:Cu-processing system ATP-binding protein
MVRARLLLSNAFWGLYYPIQAPFQSTVKIFIVIANTVTIMKVGKLIEMMKDLRNMAESDLDLELFSAFQIDSFANKPMRTLSGGMRQKVSASLALLFNPDILILDEPTAGLDPLSSEILKSKLLHEKAKGKLILVTSHVLSDLEELTTDVMYLMEGRVQFNETIEMLQLLTGEQRLNKAVAERMKLMPLNASNNA